MEDLRNQSFPSKTLLEWKEKAEGSLKGKSVESLYCSTYENIILKPLYSRDDEKLVPNYPGGTDSRRGIYPLGYLTNEWKVAQRISYTTVEELKEKLIHAVEKGQTAISFEGSKVLFDTQEGLANLLSDFYDKYPFAIHSNGLQNALLSKLANVVEQDREKITGYIGYDPISLFAVKGLIPTDFFKGWVEDIKIANEIFPNLRTILIDSSSSHNSGANAVQELGIAIAEGVFYLQQLLDSGMKLETILSKIIFHFSIGSNFFMEIAKLRAARILWNKIIEVYGGAGSEGYGMQISTETSAYTKTVQDPYVNLLRSGNEAFAAAIGGIQYLHVAAFNEVTGSNPFSERIARNTQLILKEEAHMQRVIDPAGGSWYIEELTTQLAEKGWEFFQQIEAHGGILESLKSNWLQNEVAVINDKRMQDAFTRKQSIVGTNVYANPDEVVPTEKTKNAESYFINATLKELLNGDNLQLINLIDSDSVLSIESIGEKRLAKPYEKLRRSAAEIKMISGNQPFVAILCLGELRQHKARLDFMRGFLSAGGIKTVESNPIFSIETAKEFVLNQNTKHFCFCGNNEQYEEIGHDILQSLKNEFPDCVFYLAGLPEKDQQTQWMHEGIKQFIHVKSNCFETLSSIVTEMEVTADEAAKA